MERNFTNGVQKEAKSTLEVGKNVLLEDTTDCHTEVCRKTVWEEARGRGLEHLVELKSCLDGDSPPSQIFYRSARPLGFEQLEMLEAELVNQGILVRSKDYCCGLAQHVLHEANIWRWRAQRFGVEGSNLVFNIDLPAYVVYRAEELMCVQHESMFETNLAGQLHRNDSWWGSLETLGSVIAEIHYLNRFAAYLLGVFDEAANGYQRGLNLVLKVLSREIEQELEVEADKSDKLMITLPHSKREFFSRLKEFRQVLEEN